MKKSLVYTITLLAILAISATALPSGRTATQPQDETGHLHLVYSHYFIEGALVVVGEVTNTGPNTITNIILTGQVAMSDGSQGTQGTKAWVVDLVPNQHAPFYMEFFAPNTLDGAWPSQDIVALEIYIANAEATSNYQYPDLTISGDRSSVGNTAEDNGVFWVSGSIQNTGTQQAQNVSIVATFYNSTGCPIGIGTTGQETVTPNMLSPQQTATFKLGAFDLNQTLVPSNLKITSYSLLAQVIAPILQGAAPQVTPTAPPSAVPSSNPSDTTSPTDSSSQPTDGGSGSNETGTPTWVYATAAVIVLAALIGVVMVVRRRKTQEETPARKPTKPATTAKKPAAKNPPQKPTAKKPLPKRPS